MKFNKNPVFIFRYFCLTMLLLSGTAVAGKKGPEILYWESGGIAGVSDTVLAIDSTGIASCFESYPVITHQLSDDQYRDVAFWLLGFDTLADTYKPTHRSCVDQFFFHLECRHSKSWKKIVIDQCIFDEDEVPPAAVKLNVIILQLRQIADSLSREYRPWKGMKANLSLNKLVYGLNEPIRLSYLIENPTNEQRTLYFRHSQQFNFSVNAAPPNPFMYRYPRYLLHDTTAATQIAIQPGSHQELSYLWNYASDANIHITPGIYDISMGVLAGSSDDGFQTVVPITFEIADTSTPIGGKAWIDTTGSSNNLAKCQFMLTVQNWTKNPVALHFPTGRFVLLELYVNTKTPENLLYRDSASVGGQPSMITLASEEKQDYSCTLPDSVNDLIKKKNLGGEYLRCIVTLLSTEYSIKRETGIAAP